MAVAGALTLSACNPIELSEELSTNKVNLKFHSIIHNTPVLRINLTAEAEPVQSGPMTNESIDDFRGPPGWYYADVTGDLDSDSDNESIKALFKYDQATVTNATFSALSTFAYSLTTCEQNPRSIDKALEVIQTAFGIDPSIQNPTSEQASKFEAIEKGIESYAEELETTYTSLITIMTSDLETDCLLNGYSQNMGTGARDKINYFGTDKTAAELASGIAAKIVAWGNENNIDMYDEAHSIINSSSDLFDDRATSFDDEAPEIKATTDLEVSLFNEVSIEFSYKDLVGLNTVTANINNSVDLTPTYDHINNKITLAGDVSALPTGDYHLNITSTDISGNTGQSTFTVVVDNIGPSVALNKKHHNTSNPTLNFTVATPYGDVTEVKIGSLSLTQNTEGYWVGEGNLIYGENNLSVEASTNAGFTVTRDITAYYETTNPVITIQSSQVATAFSGDVNAHELVSSDTYDFNSNISYLFGTNLISTELNSSNIPYLNIASDDPVETGSTEDGKVELKYQVKVNNVITRPFTKLNTDPAILPMTFEYLGQEVIASDNSDTINISIKAIDLAGNETVNEIEFGSMNTKFKHEYNIDDGFEGDFATRIWKSGSTTEIAETIVNHSADQSLYLNTQYEGIQINLSGLSWSNEEGLITYSALDNRMSEVIILPTTNSSIPVGIGSSIFGAFTSSGYNSGSTASVSHSDGVSEFESKFPGVFTTEIVPVLNTISDYTASANAAIFREAMILAADEIADSTDPTCNALGIDYLIAQDFKDDLTSNNSNNPTSQVCEGSTPYKATKLVAKHMREISNDLGLLEESNNFDLNIGRSFYAPVNPTMVSALDVDTYSGTLAFKPKYTTDTDTYTVKAFLNGALVGTYNQDETVEIVTSDYANGVYVIRLEMTDLFYNTNIHSVFSTFEN